MHLHNLTRILIALVVIAYISSCKKYLDVKQRSSIASPVTLKDFQALLDHTPTFNTPEAGLSEISADNYYLTANDYNTLGEDHQRIYTWQPNNLFTGSSLDWLQIYRIIFRSNLVLEGLDKVDIVPNNQSQWEDIRGQALYQRAKAHLQIANIWTLGYDKATATTTLGVPLRLQSDFSIPSVRSTLEETYRQIIVDAKDAALLLPNIVKHTVRPCKAAGLALIARAYLAMREYDSCAKYANGALALRSTLLDYNVLNPAATAPFAPFEYGANPEILHSTSHGVAAPLSATRAKIDSLLYQSYATNDLRRTIFFRNNGNGTFAFKGSYATALFWGFAVDELYLMRAECYARAGNTTLSMQDLNTLLQKRWKTGTFIPFSAANAQQALQIILTERRKELLFRGLRWMDLKRLNLEGAGITLTRNISNTIYTLPPNDLRYALPIPDDIILLTGMPQNPR